MSSKIIKTRKRLSVRDKLAIIDKLERGATVRSLANIFNVGKSTISRVKRRKGEESNDTTSNIKSEDHTEIMNPINRIKGKLDCTVYSWYLQKINKGEVVNENMLCDRALQFNTLLEGPVDFKADDVWLNHFTNCYNLKDLQRLENHESVNKINTCKACLCVGNNLKSLLDNNILNMFKECISLEINIHDALPKHICQQCYDIMCEFYVFKNLCMKSEVKLKQKLISLNIKIEKEENSNDDITIEEQDVKSFVDNECCNRNNENLPYTTLHIDVQQLDLKCETSMQSNTQTKSNAEIYKCTYPSCNNSFYCRSDLKKHQNFHYKYKCSLCRKIFKSEDSLKMHNSIKHKEIENYKCDQCSKGFQYKARFKQHMLIHKKSGEFQCDICKRKFKYKTSVALHMTIHTRTERKHKCKICPRSFHFKNLLEQHLLTHTDSVNYKCQTCDKMFQTKEKLRKHALQHIKPEFNCQTCSKSFHFKSHLAEHLLTHTNSADYKCDLCGNVYKNKHSLIRHKKLHEEGEGNFKCDLCTRVFKIKSYLNEHLMSHKETRDFSCKLCEKMFKTKGLLASHLTTHIKGEKRFKCEQCPRSFHFKCKLDTHMLAHKDIVDLKCNTCDKMFNTKCSFVEHVRTHSVGKREFKCDVCSRAFNLKMYLLRHMKSHEEREPIECGVCKRKLKNKTSYRKHMVYHNQEKKFQCEYCFKAFYFKHHLTGHQRKHHNI